LALATGVDLSFSICLANFLRSSGVGWLGFGNMISYLLRLSNSAKPSTLKLVSNSVGTESRHSTLVRAGIKQSSGFCHSSSCALRLCLPKARSVQVIWCSHSEYCFGECIVAPGHPNESCGLCDIGLLRSLLAWRAYPMVSVGKSTTGSLQ
jgi:hypothetical protein